MNHFLQASAHKTRPCQSHRCRLYQLHLWHCSLTDVQSCLLPENTHRHPQHGCYPALVKHWYDDMSTDTSLIQSLQLKTLMRSNRTPCYLVKGDGRKSYLKFFKTPQPSQAEQDSFICPKLGHGTANTANNLGPDLSVYSLGLRGVAV